LKGGVVQMEGRSRRGEKRRGVVNFLEETAKEPDRKKTGGGEESDLG